MTSLRNISPACEVLDSIGYYSLECWGGATFDSCLRFLNEDPWERLRQLRAHLPHTKLQMLFRGQNILGYKHYADDVVDEFCAKSIENGIDIIRYAMQAHDGGGSTYYQVTMEIRIKRNQFPRKVLEFMEKFDGITVESIEG